LFAAKPELHPRLTSSRGFTPGYSNSTPIGVGSKSKSDEVGKIDKTFTDTVLFIQPQHFF